MHTRLYSAHPRYISFVSRFSSTKNTPLSCANISHQRVSSTSTPGLIPCSRNSRISCLSLHLAPSGVIPNQLCRWYSSGECKVTPITDPNRPDLFYHVLSPPTPISPSLPAFGLSFLSTPPPSVDSNVIIGWLPAASDGQSQEAGLNDFKENPKFRSTLHEAIQAGLREDVDDIQKNGALQLQYGWMHIHDERNIPALGRIGDPDDIIASVLVEDSKILAETYQAMPAYRLCTADGLTQLTEGLSKKLKQVLEQKMLEEKQGLR